VKRLNCWAITATTHRLLAISLDGYGAGPNQTVENPLGVGGEDLHTGFVATRTCPRLQ
jgi:hypothetical protein